METNDTGVTPHHSGGSFYAEFIDSLTEYLEDGKNADKHRQLDSFADSVKVFISTKYMPKPQGAARNEGTANWQLLSGRTSGQ